MITGISGTVQYLHMLHDLSSSFGLHLHGQDKPHHSLEEAIDKCQNAMQFLDAIEAAAKQQSGKVAVQGPEGSPASQTVENARMILTTLRNIKDVLEQTSPDYIKRLDLSSLLTLVCERHFSTMRSRYEMPMVLQFAQLFSPVVRESRWAVAAFNTFSRQDHTTQYQRVCRLSISCHLFQGQEERLDQLPT